MKKDFERKSVSWGFRLKKSVFLKMKKIKNGKSMNDMLEYWINKEYTKQYGELDLTLFIEQLDEMGKVAVKENGIEIKLLLKEIGYITEFETADRDYLILIEKK